MFPGQKTIGIEYKLCVVAEFDFIISAVFYNGIGNARSSLISVVAVMDQGLGIGLCIIIDQVSVCLGHNVFCVVPCPAIAERAVIDQLAFIGPYNRQVKAPGWDDDIGKFFMKELASGHVHGITHQDLAASNQSFFEAVVVSLLT